MKSKTYNGELRSSEKDFETLQLGAFATPGLLLAQGGPQVNCEIRVHLKIIQLLTVMPVKTGIQTSLERLRDFHLID